MKHQFLKVFRSYIEYHSTTTNPKDKRCKSTIQGYTNKYLLVAEFLFSENLSRISASNFKISLARKYFEYLFRQYCNNYSARCVDICATVIDWAVNEELIESNPLGSFVLPKDPPKKPTYFTPAQILKWENYLSNSTMKQKACHLFVLVMHTGFDYGDLYEVSRDHITIREGQKYIIKPRHKNGNQAIIPLTEKAEELLELYDYKMRILSNPRFNEAIKEVARELEINIYLTAKSGRKIFMMDALNNKGYDIAPVSRMGGHDSIKTTEQTYAQVNFELVHKQIKQNKN